MVIKKLLSSTDSIKEQEEGCSLDEENERQYFLLQNLLIVGGFPLYGTTHKKRIEEPHCFENLFLSSFLNNLDLWFHWNDRLVSNQSPLYDHRLSMTADHHWCIWKSTCTLPQDHPNCCLSEAGPDFANVNPPLRNELQTCLCYHTCLYFSINTQMKVQFT